MRVLNLSSNDYANMSYENSRALNSVGIYCEAWTTHLHPFGYANQATLKTPREISIEAKDFDVIQIFHSDVNIYRLIKFHKNIVIYHTGTRYREKKRELDSFFKGRVIATDQCEFLLHDPTMLYVAPHTELKEVPKRNKKIVIGHFPSERNTKGTDDIIRMLEPFKEDFEIRIDDTRVSHEENLKRVGECDVYIELFKPTLNGQPYGCFGVSAFEATALGCLTITNNINEKAYQDVYGPSPFIIANTEESFVKALEDIKKYGVKKPTNNFHKVHSLENTGERIKAVFNKLGVSKLFVTKEEWELKAKNLQDRRINNPITPNFKLYEDIVGLVHVGETVLDVGCGQQYLKKFIESKYTGVDPFPIGDSIKMSAEELTLRAETVFGLAMLDNVLNVEAALRSMFKAATNNLVILTGIGIKKDQYHTYEIKMEELVRILGKPSFSKEMMPKVFLLEWKKPPMVSIIIPYKTDRGWLKDAIDSIKSQNYDGEIEILLSQSDKRVGYNLNRGIERAKGEYVKYLCDDDWLTPNSIKDSVIAIEGNDFIHGNAYNWFGNRRELQTPVKRNPTMADMLSNNVIHGGTLMYRRDVFERIGLFDESLDCAEEYEFNLRCFKNEMKLGYSPKQLYNYRRHDNQKSLGKGVDQAVRKIKINNIKERYR